MLIVTHKDITWVKLTIEEEYELANVVMEAMLAKHISSGFMEFLYDLYFQKMIGMDTRAESLDHLCDMLESYNLKLPKLTLNDKFFQAPEYKANKVPYTSEERIAIKNKAITRTWKDAWHEHPTFKTTVDDFKYFPGDEFLGITNTKEEDEKETNNQKLIDFNNEVDKVINETGMSRQQAILFVKDYMICPNS